MAISAFNLVWFVCDDITRFSVCNQICGMDGRHFDGTRTKYFPAAVSLEIYVVNVFTNCILNEAEHSIAISQKTIFIISSIAFVCD